MAKLWQKSKSKLHSLVEQYTVGDDYILDKVLMPYDIQATQSHIQGLQKLGIFKASEVTKLSSALKKLEKEFKTGKIKIRVQDEDCHTVIENYLVRRFRNLGKKVHTGRSRNDQVLVAIRLYMKDQIKILEKEVKNLAKDFLEFAEKNTTVPLPGYSHTQQAMLSSVAHWAASFTESLIDDKEFLHKVYEHIDKNPLGSAAGFGVSMLLPREKTSKLLKFKNTQINSLYCQASRGKFESTYLEGLSQIMLTLGRFANDLILFTSQEFAFFKIKDSLVTGSSIMPQKRNLDAMEILRGKVNVILSNHQLIQNLSKGLISGYHRDLQLLKKPLIESTETVMQSLKIASLHIKGIKPQQQQIEETIKKEIFMADLANDLVKTKKIPFRTAYKKAFKNIKKYEVDLQKNLKEKISLGAPGNLDFNHYKRTLAERRSTKKTQKLR